MIDWENIKVTEPPFTLELFDEELKSFIKFKKPEFLFNRIHSHSQAVESIVKNFTEASADVFVEIEPEGFIKARLLDRKTMLCLSTNTVLKAD